MAFKRSAKKPSAEQFGFSLAGVFLPDLGPIHNGLFKPSPYNNQATQEAPQS
jgi:hypothetical protein